MIFFSPIMSILGIYVLAAVLPAFFLLRYIYKMDTVEKEPAYLLWALLLAGVWAALASILLESVGSTILDSTLDRNDPNYYIIFAFLVVAVVEEGTKLFFLKRRSWRDPNFNFMFDGIVYSVFVSLGLRLLKTSSMCSPTAFLWQCLVLCWRCRDTWDSLCSWAYFTDVQSSVKAGVSILHQRSAWPWVMSQLFSFTASMIPAA